MGIILFLMGIGYFILHFCGGSEYNKEIKEQMMWYVEDLNIIFIEVWGIKQSSFNPN